MKRLGRLGLTVSNPLFVLAAVVSWSSRVIFAHCDGCESLAWEKLRTDVRHIIVVLLILGLGFVRSAMHVKAANRLLTDPMTRRRGLLAYIAVAALHTLAVSVSIRHSTAALIAVLLAWPITLLILLRRYDLLWGEPPLPVVRVIQAR